MEQFNLLQTGTDLRQSIDNFENKLRNLQNNDVINKSKLLEYHYKEVVHNLEQIQYHMEHIEVQCRELGFDFNNNKRDLPKAGVKSRIRKFEKLPEEKLGTQFLESPLREFASIENTLRNSNRVFKSMENLIHKDFDLDGDRRKISNRLSGTFDIAL